MKHHRYNQLIAEYCGWSNIHPSGRLDGQLVGYSMRPVLGEFEEVPDYWNDLNAIHEAEKKMIFSLRWLYYRNLISICSRGLDGYPNVLVHATECIRATASQRAEAFLGTIGKWEE